MGLMVYTFQYKIPWGGQGEVMGRESQRSDTENKEWREKLGGAGRK